MTIVTVCKSPADSYAQFSRVAQYLKQPMESIMLTNVCATSHVRSKQRAGREKDDESRAHGHVLRLGARLVTLLEHWRC